jgi:hypothetical protein
MRSRSTIGPRRRALRRWSPRSRAPAVGPSPFRRTCSQRARGRAAVRGGRSAAPAPKRAGQLGGHRRRGPRPALRISSRRRLSACSRSTLIGTMLCCSDPARGMATTHGGHPVAPSFKVSSMAATIGGRPGRRAYAASQGAIDRFTVGFAKEVAGEGDPGLSQWRVLAMSGPSESCVARPQQGSDRTFGGARFDRRRLLDGPVKAGCDRSRRFAHHCSWCPGHRTDGTQVGGRKSHRHQLLS